MVRVRFSITIGTLTMLLLSGCLGQPPRTSVDDERSVEFSVESSVELRILAINDFHGHLKGSPEGLGGAAWLAAHLRRAEATSANTVIVSAGDLIGASPLISGLFHDEPTIEAANLWGLDFNAAGNHEFDEGSAELLRMQKGGAHPVDRDADGRPFAGASFQFLAANVVVDDTGDTLFPPYAIRNYDGIPVAFIGLPLRNIASVVLASGVAGLTFRDEADTVNALVAKLEDQGIEAIVVIIHQGGYQSEGGEDDCNGFSGPIVDIVARTDPAVDLFVTGHTHRYYLCWLNGRPVTSAGSFGAYYTDIDTRLDRRSGNLTVVHLDNVPVTHDLEPAPDVLALVEKYQGLVAAVSNKIVGTITADFTKAPNAAGGSLLGALIADAQLAATKRGQQGGAAVAFMNAGGMRTDLLFDAPDGGKDGNVTFAEISASQPFGNRLVTMTLTGARIHTLLEQQWAGQPRPDILAPSSGFSYAWSRSAPDGHRVDPSSIRLNGAPVAPEDLYRVTVNSFLAGGGDGFTVLRDGTERVDGVVDLDALQAFFGGHSPLTPVAPDRIHVVP